MIGVHKYMENVHIPEVYDYILKVHDNILLL